MFDYRVPISSSGKVSEALAKYATSGTKGTNAKASANPEPVGEKIQFKNIKAHERMDKEYIDKYYAGNITNLNTDSRVTRTTGINPWADSADEEKTVVRNPKRELIVESMYQDGHQIESASTHERSAKNGAATHPFLYDDLDFLTDAAKDYATLGENEIFASRQICDELFVRYTLDFFTDGNFTDGDVRAVQKQMTNVVKELAQQMKNGETLDLNKLETKLTIAGEEISIVQLMEFQKVGKELKESFSIGFGSLSNHHIENFAEIGMTKAFGEYYGSDKGELGKMFSSAINKIVDRGIAQIQKGFEEAEMHGVKWSSSQSLQDAMSLDMKIVDTFSNLNTSSKGSLSNDLTSKMNEVQALVKNYCYKYGDSPSHVGLSTALSDISNFFQSWMNKLS